MWIPKTDTQRYHHENMCRLNCACLILLPYDVGSHGLGKRVDVTCLQAAWNQVHIFLVFLWHALKCMFRLQGTKLFPTGFPLLLHLLLFLGSTGGSLASRQTTAIDGCCSPSRYGFKSRFLQESNGYGQNHGTRTAKELVSGCWKRFAGPYSFSSWNTH